MRKFAFILNPLNKQHLFKFWPILKLLPGPLRAKYLAGLKQKIIPIKSVCSVKGNEVGGYLIILPFTSEDLFNLKEEIILTNIIDLANFAADKLGISILGLNGYVGALITKNNRLPKGIKIPITTGTTLTAWSVIEAVYRICKAKRKDLFQINTAIIGADSPIGALIAKKMSEHVSKLALIGNTTKKLEDLKELIINTNSIIDISIEKEAFDVLKYTELVINVNYSLTTGFSVHDLSKGAIFCNLPNCNNSLYEIKTRPDLIVINAGVVKLPYFENIDSRSGLKKGLACAAIAETILLTLEAKLESYSFGDNINPDKLEEIADIALRNGFEIWVPEAPLI